MRIPLIAFAAVCCSALLAPGAAFAKRQAAFVTAGQLEHVWETHGFIGTSAKPLLVMQVLHASCQGEGSGSAGRYRTFDCRFTTKNGISSVRVHVLKASITWAYAWAYS
jgi:hypothetical protein